MERERLDVVVVTGVLWKELQQSNGNRCVKKYQGKQTIGPRRDREIDTDNV